MSEFNPNLWAPWRMEYIRSLDQENQQAGGCFFCRYFDAPDQDREHHVLWRSERAFVMLNRFPYTNGHLMVAVNRHAGDPASLSAEELEELTRLTYDGVTLLRKSLRAEGFNVGSNIGRCAGAGVPDHLHNHIVPRWGGDTNYMAVIGGVRVIPDCLDALYDQLVAGAAALGFRKQD